MAYSILITDDSETIRAVLKRTISMTELPVSAIYESSHGKEALEVLHNEWVDIVFTDINMPEMNGIELISEMKKHPEYRKTPVVVISTEGSTTRVKELKEKGINDYIRKPFTPESIRDVILKTLGGWNESK